MGRLPASFDEENFMRNLTYDAGARKRAASLTLNADLHTKAKSAGIKLSKVAEAALAQRLAERARAEIRQDLEALNTFVEAHGSFAEMVREHYATVDGDAPV
jgi:post-segregation antitoxin (ccd killing protein)